MRPSALIRSLLVLAASLALASCGGGGGGGGGGGSSSPSSGSNGTPAPQLAPVRPKTATVLDREGAGFLETNAGQLVLHLKGTPSEMGWQYGALVGDHVEGIVTALPAFVQSQQFPAWLLPSVTAIAAQLFRPYFPQEVKDMITGIIAGNRSRRPASFIIEDDLYFMTSLVDLGGIVDGFITCSSIAAWGPHTVDGKMFQTRCVDLFTGSGLENHTLVTIEKRDGKVPFANCGWSGMLGAISGMNAHGIAIGQVWAFSADRAFGVPWGLTTRRIMEDAVNSDDAVRIFSSETRRTYGSNFVFGDKGDGRGGTPRAYAIESSAHLLATFADNDPAEDRAVVQTPNGPECYAVKVPYAVFRGDCQLDPILRMNQTASHGPTGDPRQAGAYQSRYKGQADALAARTQNGAKVGAQEMIALTQDVAMRNSSVQCCVYANSDLEVYVANATLTSGVGVDAFTQPYVRHDFNYYLPTVRLGLDKASYLAGEAQTLTLEWETLGCDRDLVLAIAIEGPNGIYTYTQQTAPLALSFRSGVATQTQALSVSVPAFATPGAYKVVGRLYERGTTDLVDIATAPFTVN